MRKSRNLAVAAFCGALVIFGMQSLAVAQEKPEVPQDLGQNKGTGDPFLRRGSWRLVRIETTGVKFGHTVNPFQFPREKKDLPLDTRERKNIYWGYGNRLIAADLVFNDLKETVTRDDVDLKVLVKGAVTGKGIGSDSPDTDAAGMQCQFYIGSASGQRSENLGTGRYAIIYAGSYQPRKAGPFSFFKKGEFECSLGNFYSPLIKSEEDFTLIYTLRAWEYYPANGYEGDVTFNFYYKWQGWLDTGKPATSGSTNSPGDAGVGPLDRDGQYWWAQKQDVSTLESRLISNAARLFNSPSVPSEKLSSAFADVSVIIADRAAKADFSADDKDAASPIWSTHKNWAARQGPKVSLDNLKQRLSAAFNYLSRSQKDLFFADVSVAMAKAELAATANQAAVEAGPFVKPKKDVFAVGEGIAVDYGYAKSTGWDWVVIAEPGKEKNAKGSHSGINDEFSRKLEPNDNSIKDRRGTINFGALPEGKYVAKYISWPDGHAVLTSTEITVGKASSPPPPSGNPPAVSPSGDLTGLWRNPGAPAIYRVRQVGSKLVWGLDAVAMGSYANVFQGQITDDKIDGVWEDLPGSPTIGGGRMLLKIESECRFVRVSSVNTYGADVWVRIGSKCDSAALTQRSNPEGAKPVSAATKPANGARGKESLNEKPKPTSPAQTKPKIEEIADNRGRTNAATSTTTKTNKPAPTVEEIPETTPTKIAASKPAPKPVNKPPVVEEIPEDKSPKVAANEPSTKTRSKPPVVEEIPETAVTSTASNRPRTKPPVVEEIPEESNQPASTSTSTNNQPNPSGGSSNQPKEKPKKEKKPRDPNKPDIWTRLGEATRQAITGQRNPSQTQPNTQPSTQAQPQTSSCQVGPYSLAALNQPRANEQVWMRFTAPAGRGTGSGDWVGIFRAGETQSTNDRIVLWMYLTSPDCVERFNLPAGQFDAYVFDASSFRATGNRSPISRGVRLIVNP